MKAKRGLGLIEVGTDPNGASFYIAEEDDDTSGLFEVGRDTWGNAIFSDKPNASPSTGIVDSIGSILGTVASIYHQQTDAELRAQQRKPVTQTISRPSTLSSQQMMLYAGIALLAFMVLSKR